MEMMIKKPTKEMTQVKLALNSLMIFKQTKKAHRRILQENCYLNYNKLMDLSKFKNN